MMHNQFSERSQQKILLAALFCTAFSSLVYELVWCRELSLIFGSTAFASSSVLAVFMGGLAIGSLCAGKILETRRNPFRFVANLQFAIGIACILTIFAFKGFVTLESYLYSVSGEQINFIIRVVLFALTSCVLIAPTFFIGVAFPCIVQLYHTKNSSIGKSVSRCYWIDTLGASLGMLLAAFFILPSFGMFRSSLIASVLNILAGILLYCFCGKSDIAQNNSLITSDTTSQEPEKRFNVTIVLFLFFLSGFAALVLEIVWMRHWVLIYGGGLHAFAIVVVTFLLGLSIGSLFYNTFLKNIKNQVLVFGTIELLLGATALIITAIFPIVEMYFLDVYHGVDNFYVFITIMSLICFAILLIPTMLMGMTLPALCSISVSELHIGKDFGKLYAVNSLGALAGSFCAGFIIIPAVGINNGSFVASTIYIFIAFAFIYCFSSSRQLFRRMSLIFVLILVITFGVFGGLYDPGNLYMGAFYTGISYPKDRLDKYFERQERSRKHLRYYKDGVYGQVAVTGTAGNIFVRTNGRLQSGTTGDFIGYQSLIGHIPAIIHSNLSNALNIGLGAGWTIRALANHPGVEKIDCVEIDPVIVELNKNVFHSYNNDIVNNPRVNVIINDGRNYISHTSNKYDAIILETEFSNLGIFSLFTVEFYSNVKKALNEDGLLCHWLPKYEITEADYKIALNTIKEVFPYAYEFNISKIIGDEYYKSFMIVASSKPIDINERLGNRKVRRENEPQEYHNYLKKLIDIVGKSFVRDNAAIDEAIVGVKRFNTDDLPILEFHSLRSRFKKFKDE